MTDFTETSTRWKRPVWEFRSCLRRCTWSVPAPRWVLWCATLRGCLTSHRTSSHPSWSTNCDQTWSSPHCKAQYNSTGDTLYNAASSPHNYSAKVLYTSFLPDLFNDTSSRLLLEVFSHAAESTITPQATSTQMSTTVCSQVYIHIAKWTLVLYVCLFRERHIGIWMCTLLQKVVDICITSLSPSTAWECLMFYLLCHSATLADTNNWPPSLDCSQTAYGNIMWTMTQCLIWTLKLVKDLWEPTWHRERWVRLCWGRWCRTGRRGSRWPWRPLPLRPSRRLQRCPGHSCPTEGCSGTCIRRTTPRCQPQWYTADTHSAGRQRSVNTNTMSQYSLCKEGKRPCHLMSEAMSSCVIQQCL